MSSVKRRANKRRRRLHCAANDNNDCCTLYESLCTGLRWVKIDHYTTRGLQQLPQLLSNYKALG